MRKFTDSEGNMWRRNWASSFEDSAGVPKARIHLSCLDLVLVAQDFPAENVNLRTCLSALIVSVHIHIRYSPVRKKI